MPEAGEWTEEDQQILEQVNGFPQRIADKIEVYRFREALNEMMALARLGNKYLTDNEPWKLQKTNPERVKTIMNLSLQICANLSTLAEPFIPFTAQKLQRMLNIDKRAWDDTGRLDIIPATHQFNEPELLFEKVEDEVVEMQKNKLVEAKKANEKKEVSVSDAKENIGFEDFMKMDIRIGTIMEAEKVPKTKKLLKLKIDTGIDQRTVVSGIAEHYKPEDIIGKQVSILVNLEPKKLRGIESQGMILMAEDSDGKLSFIEPDSKLHNGSEIH